MTRKTGSAVLDQLRDRILVGLYFGCWYPGDRLPSVRDVARMEAVDRKTAAAAYRVLQREGLVRVEPRSGVYLGDGSTPAAGDPLRRLHARWLDNALATSAELGLDADHIARLFRAVSAVEKRRIAVMDQDIAHASHLVDELRARSGLEYMACGLDDIPATAGPLRETPLAVATPHAAVHLRGRGARIPVVQATLSSELLTRLENWAGGGPVVVLVGTSGLRRELQRALDHGLIENGHNVRVLAQGNGVDGADYRLELQGRRVLLWPGAIRAGLEDQGAELVEDTHRSRLLSSATIDGIRREIALLALVQVTRSSVA